MREYFYVAECEAGWEVHRGRIGVSDAERFASPADALLIAMAAARAAWESSGRATGVRTVDLWGQWRDEAIFGSGLPLQCNVVRLTRPQRAVRSSAA